MPSEFLDHVCTDPGERHCATSVVNENLVVRRSSRNLPGPISRSSVFGDHLGKGLFRRNCPTLVVAAGVAIALGLGEAADGALEPDALGGGAMFDQSDRCGQ